MNAKRTEAIVDLPTAASAVSNGMSVAIGGFQMVNRPCTLIRRIISNNVRDLTVVSMPAGYDIDLLIGCGCVKKVVCPYVGMETFTAIGPFFRAAAESHTIEISEVDSGILLAMLRASILKLPFFPWKGGVGTSLPEVNPALKTFNDPLTGQELIAVPPIYLDIALLHAAVADPFGNVQHFGAYFADELLARTAKKTIVQVEKLVPNSFIRADPTRTTVSHAHVDMVVKIPYGAHPLMSDGHYLVDRSHILEYLEAARNYVKGNRGPFEHYLRKYVFDVNSHEDYLDTIGAGRLIALHEF